jgi:hypothetical protein
MNVFIDILTTEPVKDDEGFVNTGDTVLARTRAYKEERHGNEKWASRAAFSTATALFRFRRIPDLTVDTSLFIICAGVRYRILSAEDVKGRGMYVEVLAEKLEPSVR